MYVQTEIPEWVSRRYRILERLGGGQWSDVYLVRDRSGGGVYAIKILKPHVLADERVRSRFLTEARAMSRIVHPNIVRIFDVGGAMGAEPAIVMEYCERGDLRQFVEATGGIEAADAAKFALYMLVGLFAAHKAGVVHRGLCPESIFLDADLRPKIGDFGTALAQHNPHLPTRVNESLGEVLYSPPEQRYDAHDVDHRCDIYGMGAIIAFMMIGRDPPDLSLASRSPEILDPIHPYLRPIVQKACMRRPEDRYRSAAAMGRAVRELLT